MSKLRVLNTRPAHQSENLVLKIRDFGAMNFSFPTIAIQSSNDCQNMLSINQTIQQYDIALFVSQNAVQHAFHFIDAENLPVSLQIGVIGKGSLDSLMSYGIAPQAMPNKTFNSEGLLDSKLLSHVDGKKVIIFRGQAGRNLLGDTLLERGASVTYCEVYQRMIPCVPQLEYDQLFKNKWDLVIFTSSEGMLNAFKMLHENHAKKLLQTPWLLISERMKKTAYNLGHNSDIIIAQQASDDGIMSSLKDWAMTR